MALPTRRHFSKKVLQNCRVSFGPKSIVCVMQIFARHKIDGWCRTVAFGYRTFHIVRQHSHGHHEEERG